jgi:hypothetical protein
MVRSALLAPLFCAAVLVLCSAPAFAVCLPGVPAKAFVGNKPADAACDYDSIQDAIDHSTDTCNGVILNITPERDWTNQVLKIPGDRKIILKGWGSGETCSHLKYCTTSGCTFNQNPRLPITPASGQSGLYVSGSNNTITLDNLEFHGGSLGADHGGAGIAFDGSGSLTLDTVTIDNNTAGWGGGLWFNGAGTLTFAQNVTVNLNHATSGSGGGVNVSTTGDDPINFTIGANSSVQNNDAAADGGGILIQHNVHLVATAPGVWIYHNTAPNGDGGGLYVGGEALADIGSPGPLGILPVIDTNYAKYGGGVAAVAPDSGCDATTVRLFTVDADHPVTVANNIATHTGGGIWVKPELGECRNPAILCAQDFSIHDNTAQEGAAIYTDENGASPLDGGVVGLNITDDSPAASGNSSACKRSNLVPYGAVSCAAGVACNEIDDNVAQTTDGTATAGAAVLMQTDSFLYAYRFSMRGNRGGKAVRVLTDGHGGAAELHDCLMAGNDETGNLIEATPGGGKFNHVVIDNCTFAGNTLGTGYTVMHVQLDGDNNGFTLGNSIIQQPGHGAFDYAGQTGGLTVAYDLSDDGSLTGTDILHGIPSFVDPANGDYHLLPTSLGVDYAPAGSTSLDLDGHARVVDPTDVPNWFGPMDLGAYEIQTTSPPPSCSVSDTVFCDGFDGE